jgi:polyhydroxybutyrate depolymerase
VKTSARTAALIAACLGLGSGCSRADVYPITGQQTRDAGTSEAGTEPNPCPSDVSKPGDASHSLLVGSQARSYLLHLPAEYKGDKPAPLVIDFHGGAESATEERSSSPYPELLDPKGVVMAFPDGLKGPAGTAWNVGPCCVADVDDVGFARAIVEDVRKLACIDARRVYAVGVLTGGGMAHYLACQAADVFAAVAPAAFDLLEENVDDCNPSRAISVVSFRGTADSRVPYAGGASSVVPGMPVTFLGARGTLDKWAQIDGCSGAASAEDAQGCARYSTCKDGAEVVLCTKQGGREEPGDPSIAWPILERHTLP